MCELSYDMRISSGRPFGVNAFEVSSLPFFVALLKKKFLKNCRVPVLVLLWQNALIIITHTQRLNNFSMKVSKLQCSILREEKSGKIRILYHIEKHSEP